MTPAEALEALAARLDDLHECVRLDTIDEKPGTWVAFCNGAMLAYREAARLARTRAAELRQEEPVEVNLDHEPVREAARQSVVLDEVTP